MQFWIILLEHESGQTYWRIERRQTCVIVLGDVSLLNCLIREVFRNLRNIQADIL